MLRRILKIDAISRISNESLQVFLLLIYFTIITSPISLYLVKRCNAKDLSLLESSAVYNANLTKDASSSYSSITAHLNIEFPNMLSSDKSYQFLKPSTSYRRKLLSVQAPLHLEYPNIELPNATNLKRQNKLSENEINISSRSLNAFLNVSAVSNITDLHILEHDISTINTKHTDNISDNAHSSVTNHLSYSNTLNMSNQSSFATSPLFENSSVTLDTLDPSFNSSNNSAIDTSIIDSSSKETTKIDSPSTDSQEKRMTSGAIVGVVVAILAIGILTGTVIYLLYQKCGKNNKLESKCPSDNCGYVDDTLRSSGYLNSHIELPKESSEEMTSLDNDSFLNSLESMTFQNYWADNTKNTKV